ncbi:NAD(P)/FAD-dependent oxidoreductase [Streptomyces sp. HPF1205]|uniref:NAD(P)/FAD-dependent oxidoreductase n=1 Tax=Streptomyces sp. HPF1205 TaxID=2873262 RepID=UPI001CEC86B8|nr:NAD(P)/FAD-dependent oxidoreductase [Streptomyces sp. HPF1205]
MGAGLAGLAAAHHMLASGLTVTVLEASRRPGGRMATDTVDGFRLDHGPQLLNTAYPELDRTPGLRGLPLAPLAPGALVRVAGRSHRIGRPRGHGPAPGPFTSPFASPLASPLDKARLGAALGRLAGTAPARLAARTETTAAQALPERGFAPRTVDGYLRPLLAALLCDPELGTSSRVADLVLRGYARGRVCLPVAGAASVPERLAAGLPPGTIRFGTRATEVAVNAVRTEDGAELPCRGVVVATDARSAGELLPGLRVPAFHQVTVVHHAAPRPPLREGVLVLDGDRLGPVSHSLPASEIDPTRAPAGRSLITSVVLGPPPDDDGKAVRAHLAELYETSTDEWELLAVRTDPRAVPAMPVPHDLRRPARLLAGLYVCGDHRTTSTVQGALLSGRRAAEAAVRDLVRDASAPPPESGESRPPGTPPRSEDAGGREEEAA